MAHLLPIHHSFEVKTWLFPYCLISCCHPVYMQGTISPAARWRKGCGGHLRVKESDVGRRPAQALAPFSAKGLKRRCVYVLTSLRSPLLSVVPFWVGKGVLQMLPSDMFHCFFPFPAVWGWALPLPGLQHTVRSTWGGQGDKTAACSPVQEWQVGIWTLTCVRTSTSPASLTGRSGCHSVVAKGEACWGVRRELHRCVTEMQHGVFYSIYAVGTANVRQHRKILPVVSRELNWAVM